MQRLLPALIFAACTAGCQTDPGNAPVSERRIDAAETSAPARSALPPSSGVTTKSDDAGTRQRTDKDWRPDLYTVKRGDTLYAIALDHGLDYRDLATWNAIVDPNRIRAGQSLRMHAPAVAQAPVLEPEPQPVAVEAKPLDARAQPSGVALPASVALKSEPKAERMPYSDEAYARLFGPDAALPAQNSENLITSVRPKAGTGATQGSSPGQASATVRATVPAGSVSAPDPASVSTPGSSSASTTAVTPIPAPAPTSAPGSVAAPGTVSAPGSASAPLSSAGSSSASVAPSAAGPTSPSATASPAVPPLDKESVFDANRWTWPARGPVTAGFDGARSKGISIEGRQGEPVLAANAGKVVYVGNAIQAYGHLAIVKHGAEFLTVYAHNAIILVKEGQLVAAGQKIAEMGARPGGPTALHFEVRKLGQPVDPMRVLPAR